MSDISIQIRIGLPDTPPPYDLLLLADPSRPSIDAYLANGIVYEAYTQDTLVGVAVVLPLGEEVAELMNIAVAPEHQDQGVGKALLNYIIEDSQTAGHRRLNVGTGNSSLNALAFYQKAGFRVVAVVPDHFADHYDDPIIENGIPCRDMIRLSRSLDEAHHPGNESHPTK